MNKDILYCYATVLFHLVLGKETLKMLGASSELYLVFFVDKFTQYKGHKIPNLLLLWTVVGGRVGYQA